jgi:hypothetical protein
VKEHKHFTGKKGATSEVEMIGSLTKMLKKSGFKDDDIVFQGGKATKLNS